MVPQPPKLPRGPALPEELTYLTIPTPEVMSAADLERAKRRAQFPPNRKGERAFRAAERSRRG